MRINYALVVLLSFGLSECAIAAFGPLQIARPVKVERIYVGIAAVYVTFSDALLTGCDGNQGGYLRPSWSFIQTVDHEATKRMMSVLLYAKSTDVDVEVRYRVNDAGAGWDLCSIDGIYLY